MSNTLDTEALYEALFAQIKSLHAWVSAQRRLRHPDDLKAANMPAVFQIQKTHNTEPDNEARKYGIKPPSENNLMVDLLIFVHSTTANEWPTSILNPILDAIRENFAVNEAPPGRLQFNTLGGLAEYCVLSGTIDFYENARSSSILAIVPIKILVMG